MVNLCKDTKCDCRKFGGWGENPSLLTSMNIGSLQIHWSLDLGGKCW